MGEQLNGEIQSPRFVFLNGMKIFRMALTITHYCQNGEGCMMVRIIFPVLLFQNRGIQSILEINL